MPSKFQIISCSHSSSKLYFTRFLPQSFRAQLLLRRDMNLRARVWALVFRDMGASRGPTISNLRYFSWSLRQAFRVPLKMQGDVFPDIFEDWISCFRIHMKIRDGVWALAFLNHMFPGIELSPICVGSSHAQGDSCPRQPD